jgi:hypothetical protein
MNTTQIEALISQWGIDPKPPVHPDPWAQSEVYLPREWAIRAALWNRPDLGWAFAEHIADSLRRCSLLKRPEYRWINAAVNLQTLGARASKRLKDTKVVIKARELHESDAIRPALNAALFTREADTEKIAEAFKLTPDVVDAYVTLFFNVPDRKYDPSFISSLIGLRHPARLHTDKSIIPTDEEILLFSGFEGTIESVMKLAGLQCSGEEESDEDLLTRLKHNTLKAAAKWSASPKAWRQNPPTIVSQGFALAGKAELEQPRVTDDDMGEFHTMARAILDGQRVGVQASIAAKRNAQKTPPKELTPTRKKA